MVLLTSEFDSFFWWQNGAKFADDTKLFTFEKFHAGPKKVTPLFKVRCSKLQICRLQRSLGDVTSICEQKLHGRLGIVLMRLYYTDWTLSWPDNKDKSSCLFHSARNYDLKYKPFNWFALMCVNITLVLHINHIHRTSFHGSVLPCTGSVNLEPVSFRVVSLALGQSYDCPSASETNLNIWMNKSHESTL